MPSRAEFCRRSLVAIGLAISCSALPARACPSCAAGREARAEVWSDGFSRHLAATLLPFVVIGAVCARVQHVGRRK